MSAFHLRILSLLLSFISITGLHAQDVCAEINTGLMLGGLFAGGPCQGPTTVDIINSGALGLDCSDCGTGTISVGSLPGSFTVVADGGCQVDVEVVEIELLSTSQGAPGCNTYTLEIQHSMSGATSYDWTFPGNVHLSGNPITYTFPDNGANQVVLVEVTNGNCEFNLNELITVDGPLAELTFDGEGVPSPLNVLDVGDVECVVSYCVPDVSADNEISFSTIDHPNASGTDILHQVTFNGATIYSSATPANNEVLVLTAPADLGYNELTYSITDSDGCVSVKNYQVYWEGFSSPDLFIDNLDSQSNEYCVGDQIQIEFTAPGSNPADVAYFYAIGCPEAVYGDLIPFDGLVELDLDPSQGVDDVQVVTLELDTTSCGCAPTETYAVHAIALSPCNAEPTITTFTVLEVGLDNTADFDAPASVCTGTTETFEWIYADDQVFGVSYCYPSLSWSYTDPDGTVFNDVSDDELVLSFTEEGIYEICLEVDPPNCSSPDQYICKTICVLAPLDDTEITVDWVDDNVTCAPYTYEPSVGYVPTGCESVTYQWSVNPMTGVSLSNQNTPDPTIDFSQKGEYTVSLVVSNGCNPNVVLTNDLVIGDAPMVTTVAPSINACPGDELLIDDLYCVDLCLSDMVSAQVLIFSGSTPCGSGMIPEWSTNILPSLPAEMTDGSCFVSDGIDELVWPIPTTASGTYTIQFFLSNDCGDVCTSIEVEVLSPSSITIPVPAQVCSGYEVEPGSTSLNTCIWEIGSAVYPDDGSNFPITGPTSITVTCIESGCEIEVSQSVSIFPAIGPGITADNPYLCPGTGSSVTLTATGTDADSYQWYNGTCAALGAAIGGATTDTYSATSSGDYAVEVTSVHGCVECAEINIADDPVPTFSCALGPYCQSETTEEILLDCLTPPTAGWGADLPYWTIELGGSDIPASINSPADPSTLDFTVGDLLSASSGATGTFTFSYIWTSPAGCDYTGQFDLVIQSLAPFEIPLPADTCAGTVIDPMSFPTLATCEWVINGVMLTAGETFIINGPTSIEVNCGSGACINSDQHQIDVFPAIAPSVTADGTYICDSGTIELTTSGTDADSYQWYNGTCAALGAAIGGATTDSYSATSSGDYAVEITSVHGCVECAEINIADDPAPTFSCALGPYCQSETAEEILLDCLTPPTAGWGADLPYWTVELGGSDIPTSINSPADPSTLDFTVGDLLSASAGATGTFTFSYFWTSAAGCDYTGQFDLVIQSLAPFEIPLPADTCAGTVIDPMSFPTLATCEWVINGVILPAGETFIVNGPTSIEVNCGSGACINSDQHQIDIFPAIAPGVTTDEAYICDSGTIELTASGANADSYQWYNGTCAALGAAIGGATTDTYSATSSGDYAVEVTSVHGCVECAAYTVEEDPAPTFLCDGTSIQFCENESTELIISPSCFDSPSIGWGTSPILLEVLDPTTATVFSTSIDDPASFSLSVQELLDNYPSFNTTTIFTILYSWTSASSCLYTGQQEVTIQAISVSQSAVTPVCQGELITLAGNPAGSWSTDALSNAGVDPSEYIIVDGTLIWNTTLNTPPGSLGIISFNDGCTTTEFIGIEIMQSPQLSIIHASEMCIHDALALDLDSDISTTTSLLYSNDEGVFELGGAPGEFSPLDESIMSTQPGTFTYAGSIDYLIDAVLYTCSDTVESNLDIYDLPVNTEVPDVCEGNPFDPAFCSSDFFEFNVEGSTYTSCPVNISGASGLLDYELIIGYGVGCTDTTQGTFEVQELLSYDFSTIIDPCIPQVESVFEVNGGQISTLSFTPSGVFTDDLLVQTVSIPVNDVLEDETISIDISIGDGGCNSFEENITFDYIAPLEALGSIPNGTSLCSPALVPFDIQQIGSQTVDSLTFIPGDGSPPITITGDYSGIQHLYSSPVDTNTYHAQFILFNPCDTDTLNLPVTIQPPVFTATIPPLFQACPGEEIDLSPMMIGGLIDQELIWESTLSLDLVSLGSPFLVQVDELQEDGIFDITLTLTPECGSPIMLQTELEVYPVPAPLIDQELACSGESSSFMVSNPETGTLYNWTIDNDTTLSGQTIDFPFTSPGVHDLMIQSVNIYGCESEMDLPVIVPGFNELSLTDTTICGSAVLDLQSGALQGQDVQWTISGEFPGSPTTYFVDGAQHTFHASSDGYSPIDYAVYVSLSEGDLCAYDDSFHVEIVPQGNAQILITENLADGFYDPGYIAELDNCPGSSIYFRPNGDFNDCSLSISGDMSICEPIQYCSEYGQICVEKFDGAAWLVLNTVNGYLCQSTDSMLLRTECNTGIKAFVPNAFTPDGDALNATFIPVLDMADNLIDTYEFAIYNRYGCRIWDTDRVNVPWDGNSTYDCYSPAEHSPNSSDYYSEDDVYTWVLKVRYIVPGLEEYPWFEQQGMVVLIR